MNIALYVVLNSHEVRSFGLNGATVVNIAINLLTLHVAQAAWIQSRLIHAKRSADGISAASMCFFVFYTMGFFVYGFHKDALNMMFCAIQFPAYIHILYGIWKYGDEPARRHVCTCAIVFASIPIIMTATPWKEEFLSILMGCMLLTMWITHLKLKQSGVENADIRLPIAFLLGSIFWLMYAIVIKNWILITYNTASIVLLLCTLSLFFRKRKVLLLSVG